MLTVCLFVLAGAANAWASTWAVQSTKNPSPTFNTLNDVTVAGTDAWAVGDDTNSSGLYRTLVEHYNGTKWATQKSPDPSTSDDFLYGVKAASTNDVWAVGTFGPSPNSTSTLVLHYDGTSWTRQTSPSPNSLANYLLGVSTTSSTNTFAVGYRGNLGAPMAMRADAQRPSPLRVSGPPEATPSSATVSTLIEHYDGTSWKVQSSPNPSGYENYLFGSSTFSTTNSWAAGFSRAAPGEGGSTLVEYYNGTKWTKQSTPNPGGTNGDALEAVSANSPSDVWAVGDYFTCPASTCEQGLILHNDGTGWTVAHVVTQGVYNGLIDVKATSSSDVWAVGHYFTSAGIERTLILHYDGSTWSIEKSPNKGGFANSLFGVAASSGTNAFAVGAYLTSSSQTPQKTLAMHCC